MRYVLPAVLAVVLAVAFLSTNNRIDRLTLSVQRLSAQLDKLLRENKQMTPGYQYHSHHYANPISGEPPLLKTVETRRKDGESVDDWSARHAERVAAALAEFPPV